VKEAVLRKIIGGDYVAREFAQEIPDLRLVAPDQFPESRRIL